MNRGSTSNLQRIEDALREENREARARALHELLLWVQKDPSIHAAALPMFRHTLESVRDTETANSAIRGIEHIVGPEEARSTRLAFLVQDPAVLSAILPYLDSSELRPHVIEALGELRDPRAISYLQPLLNDTTNAWPIDNQGPMLRVCDLAQTALHCLQAAPPVIETPGSNKPTAQPVTAPAEELPTAARPPVSYIAYTPVVIAILAVPWIVLALALTYFTTGHIASNDQETHRLDAIAALPAALGLLLGVVIVVCGWARRPIEWVCLLLGCLGCGVMLFSFGWEFFH